MRIGVQLIEFAHQAAAAVKMSSVNRQAEVVAVRFLDDLECSARRAHAAPSKAQELERKFDVVLVCNIAQVAQYLDVLGHYISPWQIAVRRGAGHNDNGWAANSLCDLAQFMKTRLNWAYSLPRNAMNSIELSVIGMTS